MAVKNSNCGTSGKYVGIVDIGSSAYVVTDTPGKRFRTDCMDEMKKETVCYIDRVLGASYKHQYSIYIIDTTIMQIVAHVGKQAVDSLPWVEAGAKKS